MEYRILYVDNDSFGRGHNLQKKINAVTKILRFLRNIFQKEIFEYLTNNKDEPSIVCRGERSQVQVYANEIMYIEISKRGTKVHTLNKGGLVEKVYSCKKSLDFLYELFKESNFAYAILLI